MKLFNLIKNKIEEILKTDMVSVRMPYDRWVTVLEAISVYENTIDELYAGNRNENEMRSLTNKDASIGMARVYIRRRINSNVGVCGRTL